MNTETGKRRVAVVTGGRAEYGIWRPVLAALAGRAELEVSVVATGMHLLERWGRTVEEVRADGWRVLAEVGLQGEQDDAGHQAIGMGRAIAGMAQAFERDGTEVVGVLGDRIEAFAGAAAASASGRVLFHIHGGDRAPGVNDEAYRHAITKLAHVHFAATAGARRRLVRLGEEAWRIHEVGSPALDGLAELACEDEEALSAAAGLDVGGEFLVVSQHPAGGTAVEERKRMEGTLAACAGTGLEVVALWPNTDAGFSGIVEALETWQGRSSYRSVRHLGRGVYVGLLKRCRALVGNSSSGLIEAGALNVDVVNVGPRQAGRERGRNVRDAGYGEAAVSAALDEVLARPKSRRRVRSVYGDGESSGRIAEVLAGVELDGRLRQKRITY